MMQEYNKIYIAGIWIILVMMILIGTVLSCDMAKRNSKQKIMVACPSTSVLANFSGQFFAKVIRDGPRITVTDKSGDVLILPNECAVLISYE
jgi:hypothetical protein